MGWQDCRTHRGAPGASLGLIPSPVWKIGQVVKVTPVLALTSDSAHSVSVGTTALCGSTISSGDGTRAQKGPSNHDVAHPNKEYLRNAFHCTFLAANQLSPFFYNITNSSDRNSRAQKLPPIQVNILPAASVPSRYEDAVAAFRQALKAPHGSTKETVQILYVLGRTLESLGRVGETLEAYLWIRREDPSYRDVATRINHLSSKRPATRPVAQKQSASWIGGVLKSWHSLLREPK